MSAGGWAAGVETGEPEETMHGHDRTPDHPAQPRYRAVRGMRCPRCGWADAWLIGDPDGELAIEHLGCHVRVIAAGATRRARMRGAA